MRYELALMLLFLLFSSVGCSHHSPVPRYYELTSSEMKMSFNKHRVITLDSIDRELLEWAVFNETNIQRRRLGFNSLKYDGKLQKGARQHSEEMIDLAYFDHISPVRKNKTLTKRLKNTGIKHGMGGENIIVHPVKKKQQIVFKVADSSKNIRYAWRNFGSKYTYEEFAKDLVRRWLNSKPHRSNILNRIYKFSGIGISPGRFNQTDVFYVTQNFSTTNY